MTNIKTNIADKLNTSFLLTELDNVKKKIIEIEDKLWMNYDSGVPSENVTEYLIEQKHLFEANKEKYISNCIKLEDIL